MVRELVGGASVVGEGQEVGWSAEEGGKGPNRQREHFFFLNLSVVDLQCCVNLCCTAK